MSSRAEESTSLCTYATPMKRFPLELLCLVFEMAMVQDVPTEEYGEPVSVHRAFFSSTAPELTLMNICGVCLGWRAVAADTPPLWSCVYIDQARDIGQVAARLRRSKAVPLDVCVNLDSQCTIDYARRVAVLLGFHVQRWRTLYWSCTLGLEFAFAAMSGKEAPLLEVFSVDDGSVVTADPQLAYPLKPTTLFSGSGSSPRLRVVELSRVAIIWSEYPLKQLTSLTIGCLPLGAFVAFFSYIIFALMQSLQVPKPFFNQFCDLLRSCPLLETLSIHQGPAETHTMTAPKSSTAPISLPRLKALDLEDFLSPTTLNALLGRLRAPNLSFLSFLDLSSSTAGGDDFSRTFQLLMDSAESFGHFQQLHMLKLGYVACGGSPSIIESFLSQLPELRKLYIVTYDTPMALSTWILDALVESSPVSCPHLEVLKTSSVDGSQLLKVADGRATLGRPLKTILYGKADEDRVGSFKVAFERLGLKVGSFRETLVYVD